MPGKLGITPGVGLSDVVTATAQLGLSVALCVFFVWTNAQQQNRSDAKADELELFIRTTLVEQIRETQSVIEACQQALEHRNRLANAAWSLPQPNPEPDPQTEPTR